MFHYWSSVVSKICTTLFVCHISLEIRSWYLKPIEHIFWAWKSIDLSLIKIERKPKVTSVLGSRRAAFISSLRRFITSNRAILLFAFKRLIVTDFECVSICRWCIHNFFVRHKGIWQVVQGDKMNWIYSQGLIFLLEKVVLWDYYSTMSWFHW